MSNSKIEVAAKFNTLVNDGQSVAGTTHATRTEIWESFRTLFNKNVTICIEGVNVTLTANHSISGKSTSYIGHIEDEQYIAINGSSDFGLSSHKDPYVTINNGKIEVHGGGKYFFKVENHKVTIL